MVIITVFKYIYVLHISCYRYAALCLIDSAPFFLYSQKIKTEHTFSYILNCDAKTLLIHANAYSQADITAAISTTIFY